MCTTQLKFIFNKVYPIYELRYMKFEYPKDMDKEMIPLCDELNSIPGISTQFCCCGHGRQKNEFYIWLFCTSIISLKVISTSFQRIYDIPLRYANLYDIDSWYVIDISESTVIPNNAISVRISNDLFNYLNEKERKSEIKKLINTIKNQRKRYLQED